jgi:lipid-A-disaccharide synthase-like uncharacterized protein
MTELLLAYWWTDFVQQWNKPGEMGWLIFGFCGNAAFFTRFLVQWIHSEKAGESKVPEFFWWQSIVGTIILLTYFIHRGDPVGMLGYIVNIIPYTRNLILVHRKKRAHALAGQEGFDIAPPKH